MPCALEYRGIFPPSSPNQILTGGTFVGVMQKAEEFELGSPADGRRCYCPVRYAGLAVRWR